MELLLVSPPRIALGPHEPESCILLLYYGLKLLNKILLFKFGVYTLLNLIR